jgi:hypothetical protein
VNSFFPAAFCILLAAAPAGATQLKKETLEAFESYARATEARLEARRRGGPFLWVDESAGRLAQVRQGKVVIEARNGKGDIGVPDGLVHDWIGAVFIPNTTLAATLAWLQDYDHNSQAYRPEVLDSRILSRNGNEFRVSMRLSKKKIITVVLDTEHDIHYFQLDPARWYSRSYSTRISELVNPGKLDERRLAPGNDHGFLWRVYSYWAFQERDGGVYVECQAVSLTRDVPTGLGWLIEPIIRDLPRQSLEHTLRATRDAVAGLTDRK